MNIRAKFYCAKVARHANGPAEETSAVDVELRAVYGDGEQNKEWSRWTPSGGLQMQVTNPACFDAFKEGAEYYIDISPAE